MSSVIQHAARDVAGARPREVYDGFAALEARNAELEETNRRLRLDIERLQRLVYLDPLTGLGNRRHFDTVAASELRRAVRTGMPLSLLICDVDHFKQCNDRYGHDGGDRVLVEIVDVLRQFCRRGGDLAVRYAGDEFALLLPGVRPKTAVEFAAGLRAAVGGLRLDPNDGERASISVGGATFFGTEPCAVGQLVRAADRALYRAKRAGRNRAEFTIYRSYSAQPSEH